MNKTGVFLGMKKLWLSLNPVSGDTSSPRMAKLWHSSYHCSPAVLTTIDQQYIFYALYVLDTYAIENKFTCLSINTTYETQVTMGNGCVTNQFGNYKFLCVRLVTVNEENGFLIIWQWKAPCFTIFYYNFLTMSTSIR